MTEKPPAIQSAPSRAVETLEQELSVLWRRARAVSHRVAKAVHPDLEPAAYGLLVLLQRRGPLRLTDVAAAIGVGKPSVSRQIVMLESLGLVRKQADPEDGRAQTISLTDSGSEQLMKAQRAREKHFRALLSSWDEEELQTLGVLLHKLNASEVPGTVPSS
ncbi:MULTISPECIES: MarR family winged helix-turn-helix transcriptional regulator [unclassified Arthrobacter]|uniref:MarR family winged helix-turn-helix transcriptional regulator n=1 Tax=unclassified Arthrobacter TaxID=235627 RepID=UPI0006DB06D7|nr:MULTISPECIES: MarR family transcriptional regulator [unclassified Arthrobacter]KPN17988.1 MarR family transcriptional regulator [Arthrobacter sp. Edens01]MSR98880.1 MarR family transcriptional regulator [Arthrobacter sp. BL-252-APC-1A]